MRKERAPVVLVIDDFIPFGKQIRHTLTRRGFQVFGATSPEKGLALFQAHGAQIDLVIIDMVKPDLRKVDLVAELERLRPGLAMLHLVGARKSAVHTWLQARAASAVMTVPFDDEQLLARVGSLLDAATRPMPDEELWERLMEASDRFSGGVAMLCIYELRQTSIAAKHVAHLRAARIRYAFRPTNCEAAPYVVIVPVQDLAQACSIIAPISVGVLMAA